MDSIKPTISFCIVSYNTRDILCQCLESLLEHPVHRPSEVIIVDNHSSDGTVEMLRREFPTIKLLVNESNLGYTVPMNQAIQMTGGSRYVVQLNPDTIILDETFDPLIGFMENHPEVGICTPKVLNRDGTLQRQCRRSAARPWDVIAYFLHLGSLNPKSKLLNGYLMSYIGEDETHPVEAVSGSCMVIKRDVFQAIGYLDENFFAYQEDADFCFRARKAGWQVYYVPEARIIHAGGQGGSTRYISRSIIEWHRSYYYYYRKNLASDYYFFFNWLYYLLMFVKLVFSLTAGLLTRRDYVGSPKP